MKKLVICGKEVINNEIKLSDGCILQLNGKESIKEIVELIENHEFFIIKPLSWNHEQGFHKE